MVRSLDDLFVRGRSFFRNCRRLPFEKKFSDRLTRSRNEDGALGGCAVAVRVYTKLVIYSPRGVYLGIKVKNENLLIGNRDVRELTARGTSYVVNVFFQDETSFQNSRT